MPGYRKIAAAVLACACVFSGAVTAYAGDNTVTIDYEGALRGSSPQRIGGAGFTAVKVADYNGGAVTWTDQVKAIPGFSYDPAELAEKTKEIALALDAHADELGTPAEAARADDGTLVFSGLDDGVYLVREASRKGIALSFETAPPSLVQFPYFDDNGALSDSVTVTPKAVRVSRGGGGSSGGGSGTNTGKATATTSSPADGSTAVEPENTAGNGSSAAQEASDGSGQNGSGQKNGNGAGTGTGRKASGSRQRTNPEEAGDGQQAEEPGGDTGRESEAAPDAEGQAARESTDGDGSRNAGETDSGRTSFLDALADALRNVGRVIANTYHALIGAIRKHPVASGAVATIVAGGLAFFLLFWKRKKKCIYYDDVKCPYRRRTDKDCEQCGYYARHLAEEKAGDGGGKA